MTGEQIVEAAKAETTLKITWLKLVGGLGSVGLAFGGGTLGVSTTAYDDLEARVEALEGVGSP